jgi:hypothetical protein
MAGIEIPRKVEDLVINFPNLRVDFDSERLKSEKAHELREAAYGLLKQRGQESGDFGYRQTPDVEHKIAGETIVFSLAGKLGEAPNFEHLIDDDYRLLMVRKKKEGETGEASGQSRLFAIANYFSINWQDRVAGMEEMDTVIAVLDFMAEKLAEPAKEVSLDGVC